MADRYFFKQGALLRFVEAGADLLGVVTRKEVHHIRFVGETGLFDDDRLKAS